MASNFTTAYIGLGVDTKEFTKDIKDVSTKTEAALRTMKLSADAFDHRWGDLTRGIKDTKRIVSGILVSQGFYALSNVLVGAGMSALTFSKNMETAAISMEYFVKGADKVVKAQAFIKTMNEFAARTPFTTEQSLALSKYMQAVGVSMNTTKSFLKVITDTAAATGATEENLQRIVFGLGQMMTKGRLANEEIRQLANANIPIYEILQQELNLTGTQIAKIGKSWVSSDKAVTAILTGLDKRYKGAADKISDTMTGMTDTIMDNAKIIAQIGFEGVFDSAKTKMTGLRDVLDTYREIVSEGIVVTAAGKKVASSLADAQGIAGKYYVGSAGLLEYILRQVDASGEFGDAIVDLIGNTRQLGIALGEAYRAAQPVVKVIGQSFYVATTVSLQALTSFSKAVAGGARGLTNLGIASEITGKTIASLYITYKAASWVSFLGQGAISAAYSLYKMAASIGSVIPPILGASAAMKTLTGGLIGAVAIGLSAAGVFNAVNNALSGVAKTMQNGGSLFDYDEVKKYMDSLAAYQEAYESPYTEIANGVDTAINGFEDVADASAAAAKSVKKDWVASFDEVYSIPEMEANKANFSDFLKAPTYDFSALDAFATAMAEPKIDWDSMFGASLWDSELVSTSFWYSLIPLFGVSVAVNLGKMFAKMRDEAGKSPDGTPWETGKGPRGTGTGGGTTGSSGFNPFLSAKEIQDIIKNNLTVFEDMQKKIEYTLNAMRENKTPSDSMAFKTLEDMLKLAEKQQEKINTLTLQIGGVNTLASEVLAEARALVDGAWFERQQKLIEFYAASSRQTDVAGDMARQEMREAISDMRKYYQEALKRGTANEAIGGIVAQYVEIDGLDDRLAALIGNTKQIQEDLRAASFVITKDGAEALNRAITTANKLVEDYKKAGIGLPTKLAEFEVYYSRLDKLVKLAEKRAELMAEKRTLEELKTGGLRTSVPGPAGSMEQLYAQLADIASKLLLNNDAQGDAIRLLASVDEQSKAAHKVFVETNKANTAFYKIMSTKNEQIIAEALRVYKLAGNYGVGLTSRAGAAFVKNVTDDLGMLIQEANRKLGDPALVANLITIHTDLATSLKKIIKGSTSSLELSLDEALDMVLKDVRAIGVSLGSSADTTTKIAEDILDFTKGTKAELPAIDAELREKLLKVIEAQAKNNLPDAPSIDRYVLNELEFLRKEGLSTAAFQLEAAGILHEAMNIYPALRENADELARLRAVIREASDSYIAPAIEAATEAQEAGRDFLDVFKRFTGYFTPKPVPTATVGAGQIVDAGGNFNPTAIWRNTIFDKAHFAGINIFDLSKIAATGTDMAANTGISNYGDLPIENLISNMTQGYRNAVGLSEKMFTAHTRMVMEFGTTMEKVIGSVYNRALFLATRSPVEDIMLIDPADIESPVAVYGSKQFQALFTGPQLYTPDGAIQTQIDFLKAKVDNVVALQDLYLRNPKAILYMPDADKLTNFPGTTFGIEGYNPAVPGAYSNAVPVDAKLLASFSTYQHILEQFSKGIDELGILVYEIPANAVRSVMHKVLDSNIMQSLLQQVTSGSPVSELLVFDPRAAGLAGPDLSTVAHLDPVKDKNKISNEAARQIAEQMQERFGNSGPEALIPYLRRIRIHGDESLWREVIGLAKEQIRLSAAYVAGTVAGMPASELTATLLANGKELGRAHERFISDVFKSPKLPAEFELLESHLEHLYGGLKTAIANSDNATQAQIVKELTNIRDALVKRDWVDGTIIIDDAIINVGKNSVGMPLVVDPTKIDVVDLATQIEAFMSSSKSYQTAAAITMNDLTKTLNSFFDEVRSGKAVFSSPYTPPISSTPMPYPLVETILPEVSPGTPTTNMPVRPGNPRHPDAYTVQDFLYQLRAYDKGFNGGENSEFVKQLLAGFRGNKTIPSNIPEAYAFAPVEDYTNRIIEKLTAMSNSTDETVALNALLALRDLSDTFNTIETIFSNTDKTIDTLTEAAKTVDSLTEAAKTVDLLNFASKGGFINLKTAENFITFMSDFFTKGLTFSTNSARVAESTAGLSALFNLMIDANPDQITQVVGAITKWLPSRLTTAFTDFAIKAAQALNANALPIIGANGMLPQVVSTMSGFGNNYFQAGIVRDMEGAAKFFLRTGENLFDVTRVGAISAAEQASVAMHSFATKMGYSSDFIDKFVTDYVSHVSKYVSWGSFTGADDLGAAAGKSLGNLDEAARLLKGSVGWAITFSADDLAKFLTSAGKWSSYVGLGIGYIGELVEGYKIRVARDEMLANSKYSGGDAYYVAKSAVDMLLSAISPGALLSTRSGEAQVMQDYWRMTPDEQVFWGGTQFTSTQDSILTMLFGGKRGDFGASYSERLIVDARETAAKLGMDFATYVQQELNKKSDLAKVIDYIVRSGDIHSNIAKAFYREFSDIFETVIRPAFVNITAEWERQGTAQYTSVSNWDRQNQGLVFGANEWAYKNMPKLIQEAVSNAATNVSPEFYDRWTSAYSNGDISPADGSTPQQISVTDAVQAARTAAGMDAAWNANVNALITSGGEQIQQLMVAMFGRGLASASEATWEMKPVLDDILKQVVDSVHAQFRPLIDAADQNVSANFGSDPEYARVFAANLSDMMDSFAPQLATTFGMSFTQLSDGIAKMSVNIAEVSDNIAGFRFKMPDEFKIDQAKLTTTDMAVLAQAGIQINSDGTVSVMTAQRNNTVGAVREVDLRAGQLAQDTLNKLATGGININFGEEGAALDFDIDTVAKNMRSALFALTGAADPSSEEIALLAGLGNFDSSGMFEVTNQEVLSGTQTIAGYFESLGAAATANFGETRQILEDIDAIIALGGEASRETIAKMADGITLFSPILASEMTTGLDTAFTLAGATFVEHGDKLILAINHLGERLNHGVTVLTEEAYRSLSAEVKVLLTAWGVLTKEEAGMVLLDTSNVIKAGQVEMLQVLLSDPSIYSSMPVALQEALQAVGIAMQDGLVSIDLATHDGLLQLNDNWYTSWNTLSEDTVTALKKVNMDTSAGLLKVEKLITDSGIPEALDGQLVAKFEDLPKQIQDSLLTGDDSVDAAIRDGVYRVEQTTSESFMGVVNAVTLAFKDANTAAKEGVEELGESLISSMLLTQQITNAISHGVGTSGGFGNPNISWGPGSQKNTIDNVGFTRGGVTYYKERNSAGEVVAEWYADPTTGLFKREVIKRDDVAGAKVTYNPDRAARGGLITEHAIYQAGEFGRKEAVVPLENRSVLAKVGQAVGTFVPAKLTAEQMSTIMSGVTVAVLDQIYSLQTALSKGPETNHEDLQKLNNDLAELFSNSDTVNSELFANLSSTIRASAIDITSALTDLSFDITGALSNLRQTSSYAGTDTSYTPETDISDPLSSVGKENYPYTPGMHKGDPAANALLADAVANVTELPFTPKSFTELDLAKTVEDFTTNVSDLTAQAYADEMLRTLSVIENRKAAGQNLDNQYAWLQGLMNVNTNATATLAQHAALETVKEYYKDAIYSAYDIKGSARGSLVTKDALYRAGEFGLNEAIIPLENPSVMRLIGEAIYNSIPNITSLPPNGGLVNPEVRRQEAYDMGNQEALVASTTRRVLEAVLPAIVSTEAEPVTPVYVGTLIADEQGLKMLERKLYDVRLQEERRRK